MPTLGEALRFVRDPGTSEDQLRRACELLFLDASGGSEILRSRLLSHLDGLAADSELVCLNPGVTSKEAGRR